MTEPRPGFFERIMKKGGDLAKVAVLGAGLVSAGPAEAAPAQSPHAETAHQQETKEAGASAASQWAVEIVAHARATEREASSASDAESALASDLKTFTKKFYFPEDGTSYSAADYGRIRSEVTNLLSVATQADAKFGTHLVTGDEGAHWRDQLTDIQGKAERGMSPSVQEARTALDRAASELQGR